MLKSILILAALLVSPAAFAGGETAAVPDAGADKSICDFIRTNEAKCLESSSICKWDEDDGRCEPIQPVGLCYSDPDVLSCNGRPNCVWDEDEGRCERLLKAFP